MLNRIWNLFIARNKEFYRDKSALGWSILFPFLIIIGFSLIFSREDHTLFKAGLISDMPGQSPAAETQIDNFRANKFIDFIEFDSEEEGLRKLEHHRIDILIKRSSGQYWISSSSPSGYISEKLLFSTPTPASPLKKESVSGREIPYVEWLFPGIIGMDMMFSALFGVGHTVVRYRKNGMLKRLSVTPLKPWEFLAAQVLSRIFVMFITTSIVYTGCMLLYDFQFRGSYLALFTVFLLGGFSIISLGLVVVARINSEELAGGLLNLLSWPMMFLSGVWFSLEGTAPWVIKLSNVFPLTHLIESARLIINDGAGLYEIRYRLLTLAIMSVVFLCTGSLLFEWKKK